MGFIVQKFGGTSVADKGRILHVAKIIKKAYDAVNDVVVVVSAQGDMTDLLIEKANEISRRPSKREMDMLLASGEQVSISLLAMALESLSVPVVSLLGWQAGVMTDSMYGYAKICKINTERIKRELDKNNVVIVAGFQGINKYDDVTTLGRGGSDTSAVAIAAAMKADKCQIYTDVEGVYTSDPRLISNARKLPEISYEVMLEFATLGAQVLNNRSVEMAWKHNVIIEVLSSMKNASGTIVKEDANVESLVINGVAKDDDVARVSVMGVPDIPGYAFKLFSLLAAKNINVDIILQANGCNDTKDIVFTLTTDQLKDAVNFLNSSECVLKHGGVSYDAHVSKVSVIGCAVESHHSVATQMFEALYESNINIQMISTSEMKISVLIDEDEADKAVKIVHRKFFGDD